MATEALVAIVRPSPFVTHDILGRENTGPVFYEIDESDSHTYDLQPHQNFAQSLLSDYKTEVEVNAYSLRNQEIDDIDPQSYRILILGDSQTFGHGVRQDETFAAQTEKLLRERGKNVVVLNGGVHGYGTYDMLWKLERLSNRIEYDFVIVVCFLDNWLIADEGNDLWKNFQVMKWSESDEVSGHEPDSLFLLEHFHTYFLLSYLKRKISGSPSYTEQVQSYRTNAVTDEDLQAVWAETRRLIKEMSEYAWQTRNARMLILHLPSITSLKLYDKSAFIELEKTGLPVLSIYDQLKAAGDQSGYEQLQFQHDSHYNARAHKIIATHLVDYLLTTEMSE